MVLEHAERHQGIIFDPLISTSPSYNIITTDALCVPRPFLIKVARLFGIKADRLSAAMVMAYKPLYGMEMLCSRRCLPGLIQNQ